jgi:ligand-binding SRPBCC domain-containing protein
MFVISDSMHIHAPIERCFLLSTSIDLVAETLQMRPVSGRTSGLIVGQDRIVWKGWKFGLPQMHESLISGYERPAYFQDTMARGRFKFFQHDHHFTEIDGHTLLQDKVRFSLPLGWAGAMVAKYVMVPYISRLIRKRFYLLKQLAEGPGWKSYLAHENGPENET